jgi:methylated-DNA-[protein]-cysteine S-methyltransferase
MTYSLNSPLYSGPHPVSRAIAIADDPCDVVEEAIPALVIGDLSDTDQRVIDEHCDECGSCSELKQAWTSGLQPRDLPGENAIPEPAQALGLQTGHFGLMESPVGDLLMVVTDHGVADVSYLARHSREDRFAELERRGIIATERPARVSDVRSQLDEYFAETRTRFSLPIDLQGVSSFTRRVLEATHDVPFGDIRTYKGIATAIGKPSASRAVGNALGRNPIPVIVPCHRVVRADGSMGRYTGGADIKRVLLDLEGVSFDATGSERRQPGIPGLT